MTIRTELTTHEANQVSALMTRIAPRTPTAQELSNESARIAAVKAAYTMATLRALDQNERALIERPYNSEVWADQAMNNLAYLAELMSA